MSRYRYDTPDRKPSPRPSRLRPPQQQIPEMPLPKADVFAWAPGEVLIGQPRAGRKAKGPGNA